MKYIKYLVVIVLVVATCMLAQANTTQARSANTRTTYRANTSPTYYSYSYRAPRVWRYNWIRNRWNDRAFRFYIPRFR